MNYVKKMCILRQLKQGFSGDGKTLSGLVKIEQYGKNLAVEVSIINFAPLSLGEYYCLLSDGKGKTEMLSLRGKSMFNILSDVDITGGFCAVICYVKNDVEPIAYGINGNGSYDWRTILNATLPPVFPEKKTTPPSQLYVEENALTDKETKYNDEKIVEENYYQEQEHEQHVTAKSRENARIEGAMENAKRTGTSLTEDANAPRVRTAFDTDGDGYYQSVKTEIDQLFATYPKDDTLSGAFSCSEWVRVKGTAKDPQYLVGVLYQDGRAKYICYALSAQEKENPPEEIKDVCAFVPTSVFSESVGYFIIFQSATTGECIKPEQV